MMPQLFDYQKNDVEALARLVAQGHRHILYQAPTGSGKTTTVGYVAWRANNKGSRTLFIAHRRRLVQQMSDRLTDFGLDHGIIMDGYEPSVASIQVASRDTLLARSVRRHRVDLPRADLVVLDEAHNMSERVRALLSHYKDSVIIGATATPARSDGYGLGDSFTAMHCSLPIRNLIDIGRLVPARCYRPVSRDDLSKRHKGIAGDPVAEWKRLAEGRPTVAFCSKVSQSREIVERYNQAGIAAVHIDAHTPDDQRDEVYAKVESGRIKVVCQVGIMTEGVDLPALSCCQILRPCGSYVIYAQAVGRVLRAHPSKSDAIIIDHCGAVIKHGFPDMPVEWQLERSKCVDDDVQARLAGLPEDQKPVACIKCGVIFSGTRVCPGCGHVIKRKPAAPEPVDSTAELLRELTDDDMRQGERQKSWTSILFMSARSGKTCSAAASIYARRWGQPPWMDGVRPLAERQDWRLPVDVALPQFSASRR
jgi:superfamily II DNA or RNA helicase